MLVVKTPEVTPRSEAFRVLAETGQTASEHCLPQCGIKPIVSDSRKY
jgi:hypothetical protein